MFQTKLVVLAVVAVVSLFVGSVVAQTQVYFNDFEGAVGAEWSNRKTEATPVGGRRFLGQFGNGTVSLTLQNLPSHDNVIVAIDLFIIATMDGNAPGHPEYGPDIWKLNVRNGQTLLQTTFSNIDGDFGQYYDQAYPDQYPGGSHPPYTGATEIDTLGYTFGGAMNAVYHLNFKFPHMSDSLILDFIGSLKTDGISEESWGIDNVKVELIAENQPPQITQMYCFNRDSNNPLWEQLSQPFSQFNAEFPTAVIVHGWNCNCTNSLNDKDGAELPWTLKMAKAIHEKIPNGRVNIMAWDWLYLARSPDLRDAETCSECSVWGTTTHHVPGEQVLGQAQLLSKALNNVFRAKGYATTVPIHLIGHSLGAHVVAWTGVRMLQSGSGFIPMQVTCMDPPEADYYLVKPNLQNICVPLSYLRDNSDQVFTEFYHGQVSALAHNVELWVNIPGWTHDVYNWYTDTIEADQDIPIYQFMAYPAGQLSGTIGFGASVLLPSNGNRLAPICNLGKNETMAVSKIVWPPFADGFNFWPDCRTYNCTCDSASCQQAVNPEPIDLTNCVCSGDGDCQKETNRVVIHIPGQGRVKVTVRVHIKINWYYLNFNCNFTKTPGTANVTCVIKDGDKEDTVWTGSSDAYGSQNPFSSGSIDVSKYQDRDVDIVFETESAGDDGTTGGTDIVISDPVFSQDPSFGTPPPDVPAQLPDIPNVVLTDPGSGKGTVTLQCPPCKNPGEDITEYIWIVDGDYYSGEVVIDIELEIGIHVISLCLVDKFNQQTCADKEVRIISSEQKFIRGDSDLSGQIDISDPIRTLNWLFLDTSINVCKDAADADDSGVVEITDAIYVLGFLFVGGKAPAPPYPDRGIDATQDTLGCDL